MHALREVLNVVFPSQPCHFKKNIINIIIHNVYFFKFRADEKFCSLRKPKEESTNERQERESVREGEREKRERERGAITHCIQFFI